ncbi:DsbA family protein [Candidatus Uhrbacteria bacterium]|nr:DsbA family protein [Candidatus Uhrbacteria bacterium]
MRADLPWYRRTGVRIAISVLAVFVIGIGFFTYQIWHYYSLFKSGEKTPFQNEQMRASIAYKFDVSENTDQSRILPQQKQPELGSATASVVVVEFLDYDCPFCRESEAIIKEFLRIHASEVRFIVREFPIAELHPEAEDAAAAARCVFLQNKPKSYWTFQDRLFGTQGTHDVDSLRIYAGQTGIDISKYDDCILRRIPQAALQASLDDGIASGVRGTPTFFFNGVKFEGVMTLPEMEEAFAQAKQRVKK